jgi:hypothetical protein
LRSKSLNPRLRGTGYPSSKSCVGIPIVVGE